MWFWCLALLVLLAASTSSSTASPAPPEWTSTPKTRCWDAAQQPVRCEYTFVQSVDGVFDDDDEAQVPDEDDDDGFGTSPPEENTATQIRFSLHWPTTTASSSLLVTSAASKYEVSLSFNLSLPFGVLDSPAPELLVCARGALKCDPRFASSSSSFHRVIAPSSVRGDVAAFTLPTVRGGDEYTVVMSVFFRGNASDDDAVYRASIGRTGVQVLDEACSILLPSAAVASATCRLQEADRDLFLSKRRTTSTSSTSLHAITVSDDAGAAGSELVRTLAIHHVGDARFQDASPVSALLDWPAVIGGRIAVKDEYCLPEFNLAGTVPFPVPRFDAAICEWDGGVVFLQLAAGGGIELKYWWDEDATDGDSAVLYDHKGAVLARQLEHASGREVLHGVDWFDALHLGSRLSVVKSVSGRSSSCVLSRSPAGTLGWPDQEPDAHNALSSSSFSATGVSCDSAWGRISILRADTEGSLRVDVYAANKKQQQLEAGEVTLSLPGSNGTSSLVLGTRSSLLLSPPPALWSLDALLGLTLRIHNGGAGEEYATCTVELDRRRAGTTSADAADFAPLIVSHSAACVVDEGKTLLVFEQQQAEGGNVSVRAPGFTRPFLINADVLAPGLSEFQSLYMGSASLPAASQIPRLGSVLGLRLSLLWAGGEGAFTEFARCVVSAIPAQPTPAPTTGAPTVAPSTAPSAKPASNSTNSQGSGGSGSSSTGAVFGLLVLLCGCGCGGFWAVRRSRRRQANVQQEGLDHRNNAKMEEWSFQMELGKGLRVALPPVRPKFTRLSDGGGGGGYRSEGDSDDDVDEDDRRVNEDVTRV